VKLGRRDIAAALVNEASGNRFDDRDWLGHSTPLPGRVSREQLPAR
jgi:hypothetical protein